MLALKSCIKSTARPKRPPVSVEGGEGRAGRAGEEGRERGREGREVHQKMSSLLICIGSLWNQ